MQAQDIPIRKIEGNGTISRSQDWQYINTLHIPHEKSIKSVSYYTRRKKQLKRNPSNQVVVINLTNNNAQRTDQIVSIIKSNKNIDPFISNYIKEIRLKPVINHNKYINFSEQLYPLNQNQKVKVVEDKYFSMQNYYNYLLDLQQKKQISRGEIYEEDKAFKPVKENKGSSVSIKLDDSNHQKYVPSLFAQPQQQHNNEKQDKRVRGKYKTRFQLQANNIKTQNNNFSQQPGQIQKGYPKEPDINFTFTVSQKKRIELEKKKKQLV